MYVVLERPDQPPQRIKVAGNKAVVGRSPQCDVVIDEEFVSKQHVVLLSGIVAVDQSTNGTFIDGERVTGPTLLGTRSADIAMRGIILRVELDAQEETSASVPGDVDRHLKMEELRQQIEELTRAKAVAASGDAAGDLAALRTDNDQLRAKVEELERRLQEAPVAALPDKPADDSPVSMLIFKLQRENAELKRAIAQQAASARPAQQGPPTAPLTPAPTPAPAPKPAAKPSVLGAFPAFAKLQKGANDAPAAPEKVPAAAAAAERPMALARLEELVKVDADELPTRADDALEAFLMAECFRFLRRVERVVSRVSSGFIQLYQAQTLVPGVEGTLRDFLRSALANPGLPSVRDGFLTYLREMGRWMVASLMAAYRQAAEKLVAQLRTDLSPEALAAEGSLAIGKKISSKSEAELWRRVCAHLRDLNADAIRERLERYAREAAEELVGKDGSQAFA